MVASATFVKQSGRRSTIPPGSTRYNQSVKYSHTLKFIQSVNNLITVKYIQSVYNIQFSATVELVIHNTQLNLRRRGLRTLTVNSTPAKKTVLGLKNSPLLVYSQSAQSGTVITFINTVIVLTHSPQFLR
jgi:hypothetical protein